MSYVSLHSKNVTMLRSEEPTLGIRRSHTLETQYHDKIVFG